MAADGFSFHLDLNLLYRQSPDDPAFAVVLEQAPVENDDQLADLIEADGRLRLCLDRVVTLDRYLASIPDLRSRPDPLDAAIDMTLRSLARTGRADERAIGTLVTEHPGLEQAIREAATLNNAVWSTTQIRGDVPRTPPKRLPCDFGPSMDDGRPRFELQEMLGEGAFGRVYAAVDRQLSEDGHTAYVSIKVMPGADRSAWDRHRITDEATKARRVDHPNVVRVLDRGVSGDNEDFIVYELVEGGDLARQMRRRQGPLDARQAARWAAAIGRGVHAAHMAGLVHCDLKPNNVVLTADGQPKVADFGVAIRANERSAGHDEGAGPLGNLAFMSPEQYRREPGALTIPSDVYALGGILYWLLTGDLANGSTAEEIRRAHDLPRRDAVAPSILDRRPDTDGDLDAIARRALAPRPTDRYPSAAAFADDLQSWLAREPIPWTRPSFGRRLTLWCRRRPSLAVATAAIILIAVFGGFALQSALELAAGQAEADAILGELDAGLTMAMEEELPAELFAQIWVLEWLFGPKVLDKDPAHGRLWKSRIALVHRLVADAEARGGADEVQTLLWRTALGFWLVRDGQAAEAEARTRETLDAWRAIVGPDDPWLTFVETILACATIGRCGDDVEAGRPPDGLARAAGLLERLEPELAEREYASPIHRLTMEGLRRAYASDLLDRPELHVEFDALLGELVDDPDAEYDDFDE